MSNNGYFDLSGIFHVQKNYLTDLSNSYPDVNNAPLVATYVHDLQNKIIKVADGYNAANTSADAVLDQQNAMINIIDAEQSRLDEKKASITSALSTEDRKTLLTNSQRLRAAEYTKILIVVVICLCIHIGLRLFSNLYINEESSKGLQVSVVLLHVANILIGGSIILSIYFTVQSRSQINFNEINIPAPNTNLAGGVPATANYDNILSNLGICEETSCCGLGTVWDPLSNTCVAAPVQPATMSPSPIPQYSPSPTSTPTPISITPTAPVLLTGITQLDNAYKKQTELQQSVKSAQNALPSLKQRQQMFQKAAAIGNISTTTMPEKPTTTMPEKPTTTMPMSVEGFSTNNVSRAVYLPTESSNLMPQNTTNVCSCGNETNNFGFQPGNYKNYYVPYN
jgi:hypothetical protein